MTKHLKQAEPSLPWSRRAFLSSLIAAGLVARPNALAAQSHDFGHSIALIKDLFDAHFFDPAWGATPEAQALFADLSALAETTSDPEAFCHGFTQKFQRAGVSHVALSVHRRSSAQLGRHFDSMEVGHGAVGLDWHGTVASLRVGTFMGVDAGPRITRAFEDITSNNATGLILDLRDNPGGSFAMRHLVGHCISNHTEAGMLLGRAWYAEATHIPDRAFIDTLAPWHGSSLVGLWQHIAEHPVTRVQFSPMVPLYEGPIVILINRHTASAAEMVAETLRTARAAVLVGEPSAGAMLVQRPYDVGDLFTLSLPVADYISHGSGRIEGNGLVPDICAVAEDAPSIAFSMLLGAETTPGPETNARLQVAESGPCGGVNR